MHYNIYMSYQLKVIKDYPIGFWELDESSGTSATDSSGCGNNGTYTGTITNGLIPLIPGGTQASKITNTSYITLPITYDYYGNIFSGGVANIHTSDNDFTLEVWIHPRFNTNNQTPILADATNNIGLFWENGNIVFQLDNQRIDYTVPTTSKTYHIVGIYSVSAMYLYVDGEQVGYQTLSNFSFTNETFELNIGPTLDSTDSFLVDAPAIYRYSLSPAKIFNHYNEIQPLPAIQIANPEEGDLFEFYDNSISKQYSYSYPANKSWETFASTDLFYNSYEDALELMAGTGSKTVTIEDLIILPVGFYMDSSKIEWDGDNGILVETSLDGSTYSSCVNGQTIPGFSIDNFSADRVIYLKITLSSDDVSKYIPRLSNLMLIFYYEQKHYAVNSGAYMSTLAGTANVTNFDVTISNKNYPILSRHSRNGIKTTVNSGFYINTSRSIRTIEFFYTPDYLNDDGGLIETSNGNYTASVYRWNNTGVITKTNISAIYVNGVNKTSQTNINNVFISGELHHVVIVYSGPVSGALKFSHTVYGSVPDLIQNIALYPNVFTSTNALDHYNLYIEKASIVADDSSFALTEDGVSAYGNDWLVVKNI